MDATREIFWNINLGEILYVLGAIAALIFVYAIYRRVKIWRLGQPENRTAPLGRRIWGFIGLAIIDGIKHRKFFGVSSWQNLKPREFYPGLIHWFIFAGAIIFLLGAFLDFLSHYFFHFMHGGFYLGYSVVTDVFGILAVIGVILALIRRYAQKPSRLDNQPGDLAALLLILVVVLTGFAVEGLRIAATEIPAGVAWAAWSPRR